ncbi:MAG: phosphoethanolamine transferase [Thiobacillus sp.]|nr:phosphoethanolamine transferase [Thiobacillus sp.]
MSRRLVVHLLATFAVAFLLFLPDLLYGLVNDAYRTRLSLDEYGSLVVVSFFLVVLRRGWLLGIALGFLGLLQLSQLLHFAYFGTLIAPHEVGLFFEEQDEIWESLIGVAPFMAYPVAFLALAYAGIVLVWRVSHRQGLNLLCPAVILLAMLTIMPIKAHSVSKPQKFYPDPKSGSLKNTYYAVSFFVGSTLPERLHGKAAKDYLPYSLVVGKDPGPINVIVIMGESLGRAHMGLFGYERDTTPNLSALKTDPNFVYLPAISGGIATKASVPLFFNVQREPDNVQHMYRYETNLLKMAKDRGMVTHFISAQTSHLTTYSGSEHADQYLTQENLEKIYGTARDEVLVKEFEKMDLSKPNFVVLHQRTSHSPYQNDYPAEFEHFPTKGLDKHAFIANTYDNSVRYTDHIVGEVIRIAREKSKLPTYIFFTPDHGELIDVNGKYGHCMLDTHVPEVPFVFYAVHGDAAKIDLVKGLRLPTHYEIGKTIAAVLGYEVVNPNEVPGSYFVNGVNLDGSAGHMSLKKDADGRILSFEPELP